MRRLAAAAIAIALLGGLLFALPWLLVDREALGRALAGRLSVELGEPVAIGEVDLAAWPLPALRIRELRVGDATRAQPLLVASEVRMNLSLVALLAGRVALRSLEIHSPRVRLEVAPDGWPVLPGLGSRTGRTRERGAESHSVELPFLAISRIRIRDGSFEAGGWRLENLVADASIGLDLSAAVDVEVDVPGLGKLRDGRLELDGLGAEGAWSARGSIADVDLGSLRTLAGSDAALWGSLRGELRASGRGKTIETAAVDVAAVALDLRAAGVEIHGDATLAGELGERIALDLAGARVRVADAVEKPQGAPLRISATLGAELGPQAVRSLALEGDAVSLRADLAWDSGALRVVASESTLDFERMRDWWQLALHPTAGRVRIRDASLDTGTGAWSVHGALEGVSVPVSDPSERAEPARPAPEVTASGPFWIEGQTLGSEGLTLVLAGQQASVSGSYDLASRRFRLEIAIDAADVGALAAAVVEGPPDGLALKGRLDADAVFEGGMALDSWTGSGRIEIADAFLPAASIPWPAELRLLRRDPSSGGELIDRFTAKFQLRRSIARFGLLALDHPYASVELAGDVALPGGELDLDGQLIVRRELDAELGGEGREHVLRVEHVGGTFAAPEVRFDPESLQAMGKLFQSYAAAARALQDLRKSRP